MTRRLALGLAAAVAVALAACGGPAAPKPVAPAPAAPALDAAWPALDGGTVELAELRGKIVVLHVFTVWSLSAQLELEALDAADARPDVVVIGLALDPEGYVVVAPWRKGSGARHLIALADDATRTGAGPLGRLPGVPITIVLDRAGRVSERFDRQLEPAELTAAVERAGTAPAAP